MRLREVRAGQGVGEGADEMEDARSCSRETEQWSTDKDRREDCNDARSPTNYIELVHEFCMIYRTCGHLKGQAAELQVCNIDKRGK